MHHKFVIVDGKILVNGSFNWTRNAFTNNQENVIITNNVKMVTAFQAEFEKLWLQFDPSSLYSSGQLGKWKRDEREVDLEQQA
jgi:cardiolipin hydrolase